MTHKKTLCVYVMPNKNKIAFASPALRSNAGDAFPNIGQRK